MIIMNNKRGDATIGILIAVVLGVIIIVVLVMALSGTLENLAFWIPKNNVQTMVTQCSIACSSSSSGTFDFCTNPRDLKINATTTYVGSCKNFAEKAATLIKNTKTPAAHTGSINMSDNFGIAACPGLC